MCIRDRYSPPSLRTFRASFFGSPGRRETMKIAIFCRRGPQKHEKRRHKNHEKPPPGEAYFVSGPLFTTSLPAHSVQKRAGAWHFLVRTSSVTHPSQLKTSIFFLYLGRVSKFRVRGRNGFFGLRTARLPKKIVFRAPPPIGNMRFP